MNYKKTQKHSSMKSGKFMKKMRNLTEIKIFKKRTNRNSESEEFSKQNEKCSRVQLKQNRSNGRQNQ